MLKKCLKCGKEFELKILTKKFCSSICRLKYKSKEQYYKNYEKNKKYRQAECREWYRKNKKKHNKNVLKNYHNNKEKWRERSYTSTHKVEILKLIPIKCTRCDKNKIKEIHHITYDLPKRKKRPTKKEIKLYLKEYSKYLLGFCSRFCHRRYESGM